MKRTYLIAALFAIICGLLIYKYLGSLEERTQKAEQGAKGETVQATLAMKKLVVAAQDIPPLTPLTEEMLAEKEFPADYAPENAATDLKALIGLQADGTIYTGEILLTTSVGKLEELSEDLAFEVPEGMRAMTINIDSLSGVGGYIVKGDRIDLMHYIEAELWVDESEEAAEEVPDEENASAQEETKEVLSDYVITENGEKRVLSPGVIQILLQNVEVLRTGMYGYSREGGTVYNSLTLALSPEDCLLLYSALKQGSLYATLRRTGDEKLTEQELLTVTEIFGGKETE